MSRKISQQILIMSPLCPWACPFCPGLTICYSGHAPCTQDQWFAIMGMPIMPRTDNCAHLPSLGWMDNENYLMNQVGGSCQLINFNNGFIGKPRNLREAQIYQYQLSKLHPFIPKFKEINDDYIILEDLTQNYENPCILDLKMGTQTHADFASTSNIAKHQQRNQHSTPCLNELFEIKNELRKLHTPTCK